MRPLRLSKSHTLTKDGKVKKTSYARSVSEAIRQKKSNKIKPARKGQSNG